MATRKVHVFVDSENAYRVWPSVVVLKKNFDKIQVVNDTSRVAKWIVDKGPLGGGAYEEYIDPGDKSEAKKAGAMAGAYGYMVEFGSKAAKGNSDPVIIVEN